MDVKWEPTGYRWDSPDGLRLDVWNSADGDALWTVFVPHTFDMRAYGYSATFDAAKAAALAAYEAATSAANTGTSPEEE